MLLKEIEDNGIKKIVNANNEVAIIIHNSYGSGWNDYADELPQLSFDPYIVTTILDNKGKNEWSELTIKHINNYLKEYYQKAYLPNIRECIVDWVTKGRIFYIHEYDGMEWIVRENQMLTA